MTTGTVPSLRQVAEWHTSVLTALPTFYDYDPDRMQFLIGKKRLLQVLLREALLQDMEGLVKKMEGLVKKLGIDVWRSVKLGTGPKDGPAFITILDGDRRYVHTDPARNMLSGSNFQVSSEGEREVDLVRARTVDLGYPNGASTVKIFGQAQRVGWQLCPAELGPQLRLQYGGDQPVSESLHIAMASIETDGKSRIFCVDHEINGLWLSDAECEQYTKWAPDVSIECLSNRKLPRSKAFFARRISVGSFNYWIQNQLFNIQHPTSNIILILR